MKKEFRIMIRVIAIVIFLVIISTLLPALLSASLDFAVLVGMLSYIGIIVIGATKHKIILEWFKDIN